MTGAAGFLGGALCVRLAGAGAEVKAVDNLAEGGGGNAANLAGSGVELVRADLVTSDLDGLTIGSDVVFNLAAQTGHTRGQRRPWDDLQINAAAQIRLAGALRRSAPGAVVVHTSTRQVYGRPERQPVDERAPVRPPDANAIAKLAGEQYWMLEGRVTGRPVVNLRPTNCYGPRQRVRDAEQSFLGAWIGQALRGEPFQVWGGDQVREFCFVDDLVEALVLAAETPECHGRTFNLGGAEALRLGDLADRVSALTGVAHTIVPMPDDQAVIDIGSYVADDRAFRSATGWRPKTTLAEGLPRTLDWFRARAEAYL